MAALYKLPCIFVVENNKWAIGMNHPRATGPSLGDNEPFIYKKGPAFGMPGVHVDGMDVLKVSECILSSRTCKMPYLDCFAADIMLDYLALSLKWATAHLASGH